MSRPRLLSDIVSLTPTGYESFVRCRRLFYSSALLGVPASDPAPSTDHGLIVHSMLWKIHTSGRCDDEAHVADVLAAHGQDAQSVRDQVVRHARRCPARASDREAHEQDLARFHRLPPPMFMATARIDALWIHDGMLDARDYKTGGCFTDRVEDIDAAHVQAYVLGAAAAERNLRLVLRYEYLQPEIEEDPDPWELDSAALAEVEEKLRLAVEEMSRTDDWRGVADVAVCRSCRYRSICRDSAARSEPTWPVLSTENDPELDENGK